MIRTRVQRGTCASFQCHGMQTQSVSCLTPCGKECTCICIEHDNIHILLDIWNRNFQRRIILNLVEFVCMNCFNLMH